MRNGRRLALLAAGAAASLAFVVPAAAADREPVTQARFLHAVPGAQPGVLVVNGHPPRLPSSYGNPSPYHACRPGPAKIDLMLKGEEEPAASAELEIGRGSYTVVAVPDGKGVALRAYKDDGAVAGKARLRTINAAAELMDADVRVDGERVARLEPGGVTRYASVPPGSHDLSVTRPGGEGGALAESHDVALTAGTSSTAIVVGSRGEPTEMVLVADQTAAPAAAPATGFVDDLGDEGGWLLVFAAALAAGTIGGATYLAALQRRPAPRRASVPAWPVAPPAEPVAPERPPAAPPAALEPSRPSSPGRALALGALVTAGSVGRLLYKARRRRAR